MNEAQARHLRHIPYLDHVNTNKMPSEISYGYRAIQILGIDLNIGPIRRNTSAP